jgi:hypothetical protein
MTLNAACIITGFVVMNQPIYKILLIFGHEEANQAVCQILRDRGFDLDAVQAQRRLTVLGGSPSGETILSTIAADSTSTSTVGRR